MIMTIEIVATFAIKLRNMRHLYGKIIKRK